MNILPQTDDNSDVEVVDDDVVVVSVPHKPKKKRIPFLKWIIAAILFFIIVNVACIMLLWNDLKNNAEVDDKEQMMKKPIKPSRKNKAKKDTVHYNAKIVNRNDSARN